MSAAAEARLTALDAVADAQPASADLAADLFAVADAVAGQPALRRALTDPSTPDEARQALAQARHECSVVPGVAQVRRAQHVADQVIEVPALARRAGVHRIQNARGVPAAQLAVGQGRNVRALAVDVGLCIHDHHRFPD